MKKIKLTNSNLKGIVDDEDYEKVIKDNWYLLKKKHTNYILSATYRKGQVIALHRFIMNIKDSDIQIDHKNHNGLDNQKHNLRLCTNQQNCINQRKRKNNTSGYKGVHKRSNKWGAIISIKGKRQRLGSYFSKEEAAEIYDRVALYYFPEFAYVNFKESRDLIPLSIEDIKTNNNKYK